MHDLHRSFLRQRQKVRVAEKTTTFHYKMWAVVYGYMLALCGDNAHKISYQSVKDVKDMAKNSFNWNMVKYRLSRDEAERMHDHADKHDIDTTTAVIDLATHEYKLSVTWVDNANAFCVTVTGKDDHSTNPRTSMSSWSDDLVEAILMSWYKAAVVFDWGVWSDNEPDFAWG